jgi:hypothetical protein
MRYARNMMRNLFLVMVTFVAAAVAQSKSPDQIPQAKIQKPQAKIQGTVLDPRLEPVPNARVTAYNDDGEVVGTARSDGSGRFLLTKLPKLNLHVTAIAKGPRIGAHRAWSVDDDQAMPLIALRLFDAAKVRGVVRNAAGQPIAGAQVIAVNDEACNHFGTAFVMAAETDPRGRFEIPAALLGEVAVRATADGYLLGETKITLLDDTKGVAVELQRGKGRELVVSALQVPANRLADVRGQLTAHPRGLLQVDLVLPPRLRQGRLDANGRWIVRGLPVDLPLRYVSLHAPGMSFDPALQSVEADGDVALEFRASVSDDMSAATSSKQPAVEPTLRVVLRQRDGSPVAGVRVFLSGMNSAVEREAVAAEDGTMAVDGAFLDGELVGLDIGSKDWIVDADQAEKMPGDSMLLLEYRRGKTIELLATPAVKLRGVLLNAAGRPAKGERIALYLQSEAFAGARIATGFGVTNERGEFEFGRIARDSDPLYLVVKSMRGAAELGPLVPPAEGDLTGIKLKMGPPLEVSGQLLSKRGVPVPGARVELLAWSDDPETPKKSTEIVLTDRSGRFVFRGMPAGSYGVHAIGALREPFAASEPFEAGSKEACAIDLRSK